MENPMNNFAIRHLYIQQRQKVEDNLISVNETFVPDPRSTNLTWKFYSKYKDTCDSCKNPNHLTNSINDPRQSHEDRYINKQENPHSQCCITCSGCCVCDHLQLQHTEPNTPLNNLSKYTELVANTMQKTPQSMYKDLIEPPLTSMEYGWLPGDMFTAHYDDADRKRFFRGRRKGNF